MKGRPAAQRSFTRWVNDDASRPWPPDLAVFHPKGLNLVAWFFVALTLILAFSILLSARTKTVGEHAFMPLVACAMYVLAWLVLVMTAVRVRARALIIDNLLIRHVIPWEHFAGLSVEARLGMFARLNDGRIVKSAAFGRSLADALGNYEHMRWTLSRIQNACQQTRSAHTAVSPPPPYRRQLNVPLVPALGFLAVLEAVSWIAFAAHGG
jgi:hypothetical protein